MSTVSEFYDKYEQALPQLDPDVLSLICALEKNTDQYEILEHFVIKNPSLSSAILRVANSPFFGFENNVCSIKQAIMLIGTQNVKCLVLSHSIKGFLETVPIERRELIKQFWDREILASYIAKELSKSTISEPDVIFLGSLFYDIGLIVVLAVSENRKYDSITELLVCGEDISAIDDVIGFKIPELSLLIVKNWRFPQPIISTLDSLVCPKLDSIATGKRLLIVYSRIFANQTGSVDFRNLPLRLNFSSNINLGLDIGVASEAILIANKSYSFYRQTC
ncbi:HDOD domain-containing protein [Marinobacter sp. NSM]|uniref:HDOD domain-containing protein n=1 Tax=Marinobacter sp. NSM TaxID=3458004 RepID=UPI0040353307